MRNPNFRLRLIPLFPLLFVGLAACGPVDAPRVVSLAGPRVWLDQPVDGGFVPIGSFTLKAHARDTRGGVAYIRFLVNDALLETVPTDPAQDLAYAELAWNAAIPGIYTIIAVAVNSIGQESSSAPARVCVGSSCPESTTAPITSPAVPTGRGVIASPVRESGGRDRETPATPIWPTITPSPIRSLPGRTVTIVRTMTVPPNTLTPVPRPVQRCTGLPSIASFSVSPSTITAGGSASLSWGAVTNAESVTISPGLGGVATPGSSAVSPANTTTYTLTARCGGNTSTRQVTLTVQQPPPPPPAATPTRTKTPVPPQPPAAPSGLSLKNRACSSPDQVQMTWSDNSNNESGFGIYRRVRTGATWGAWSLRTNVGANTTQFSDTSGFTSANRLEYYVRAYNAAGTSASSNTLSVSECPF